MGPRCLTCTELWPNPAIHESCADAAVFEESFGDLHNGPRIPLEAMPPVGPTLFGFPIIVDPSLPENVVEVRGETTVRIELPRFA